MIGASGLSDVDSVKNELKKNISFYYSANVFFLCVYGNTEVFVHFVPNLVGYIGLKGTV